MSYSNSTCQNDAILTIGGLAIICGLSAFYAYTMSPATYNWGYLLGYHLPTAGLGAFVYWLLTKGLKKPWLTSIGFACIYASLIFASLVHTIHINSYAEDFVEDAHTVVSKHKDGSLAEPANSSTGQNIESTQTAVGRFLEEIGREGAQISSDYIREIDGLHIWTTLDPKNPTFRKDLPKLAKSIGDAREIVSKYRKKQDALYATLVSRANLIDAPPELRKIFVNGLKKSIPSGDLIRNEIWNAQLELFNATERTVHFLSSKDVHWNIQAGKVMFASSADLAQLNDYWSAIEVANKRVERANRAITSSLDDKLKTIDTLIQNGD